MSVLLTGGTGFIGSHTAVELIENGYNVIIVDNLSNSSVTTIDKISIITNKEVLFYKGDVGDKEFLDNIFKNNEITHVIHFAAHKSVSESVSNPLKYYKNNVGGLLILLEIMKKHNVKNIVFSSSATVYGDPDTLPLTEESSVKTINPYGETKLICENIIKDCFCNYGKAVILRYFNPVGAHLSGIIGENPLGIPNNLFPYILSVVKGDKEYLSIYGDNYDTPDGTGVRDYIHVVDLAKGHLSSLIYMNNMESGYKIYNLGTGKGYSVLDIVKMFGYFDIKIKYKITSRREGDSAEVYADCSLALKELKWKAEKGLEEMVKDSINFLYCGIYGQKINSIKKKLCIIWAGIVQLLEGVKKEDYVKELTDFYDEWFGSF